MRKTVLVLVSMALAVLLAAGLAVAQSTSEVTTYYKMVDKWGSEGQANGQFYGPQGIAVDSKGNVYVADSWNDRVQKFTSDGRFIRKWGSTGSAEGQFDFPADVVVNSADNVYVVDSDNHRIQKFSSSGTFLAKWGSKGSGDGQFRYPQGVATDSLRNVYVSDTDGGRVQKFTAGGRFLRAWGSFGTGEGEFLYPAKIAVDSADNLYVADYGKDQVQKFTSGGRFVTQWGSGDGQPATPYFYPYGVAVDSADNVYVTQRGYNRVQKFTSDGQFVTMWGSEGTANGQFDDPLDVAVDPEGSVYVTDNDNARVQKFAEVPLDNDNVAPVTLAIHSATVRPLPSIFRSNEDVGVSFHAVDANGSGPKEITFRASGAQQIDPTTMAGEWAWLTIGAVGQTTITYSATDLAGNTEEPRTATVVIDKTPPIVTANTPAPNRQDVPSTANVTATFSERMNRNTINSTTFTLKRGTTTIPAVVTYDPTLKRATLNPNAALKSQSTYIATVTSGAKDLVGNALDQDPATAGNQAKTWRFKVR